MLPVHSLHAIDVAVCLIQRFTALSNQRKFKEIVFNQPPRKLCTCL